MKLINHYEMLDEIVDESGNGRLISTCQMFDMWETLAFRIYNNEIDLFESIGNELYKNEAEAKNGHNKHVKKWMNMI